MVLFASVLFLLDANVFIQAFQRHYPFDVCRGFWDCLVALSEQGKLTSIDRVLDELHGYDDDLRQWANDAPASLFSPSNETAVAAVYRQVMESVNGNPQYFDYAKRDFERGADGWLVAYASVHGLTIVTHEVDNPEVRKRVPIPNVCRQFDIPYIDTFEMLRRLDVRFEWRGP